MNLRKTNGAHVTKSQVHLLSGIQSSSVIAQEIFRKSIYLSSISKMSGQNQIAQKFEKNMDAIIEIQDSPQQSKIFSSLNKKRINFSKLPKVLTQSIVKHDRQNIENSAYFRVKSLQDGDKKQLAISKCSFSLCKAKEQIIQCLLRLQNESNLLFLAKDDQGAFNKLFFILNFDTITAEVLYENKNNLKSTQIMIIAGKYTLLIQNQNHQIAAQWAQKIYDMISQSKGSQYLLDQIIANPSFYKTRYQTEDFFTKNCQTGDIILFQDDHFFAKAQRFFTNSDFDHVGMVVKDIYHGILIFQSNGGSGVSLTPWKYVPKFQWYKHIPRIVWRRLKCQRNKKFSQIVQRFVMDNVSKNYHFNIQKLMMNTSVLRSPSQNPKEQHGYFCSELIATIYKDLGLLTRDKNNPNYQPGCNFTPKDFSQKSGRKLDEGQLSQQQQIYFNQQIIQEKYKFK